MASHPKQKSLNPKPRGGYRRGAGRPPREVEKRQLEIARAVFGEGGPDEVEIWRQLVLQEENLQVRLAAMIYLSDRKYGKATLPITAPVNFIMRDSLVGDP